MQELRSIDLNLSLSVTRSRTAHRMFDNRQNSHGSDKHRTQWVGIESSNTKSTASRSKGLNGRGPSLISPMLLTGVKDPMLKSIKKRGRLSHFRPTAPSSQPALGKPHSFFETNQSEWHVTIKDLSTPIKPMNQ